VSEAYISEIRIFSFDYPPKGWAACNGQTLPINQYQALFSLLGTLYGGDGVSTFALPNLQGSVPIGVSNQYGLGKAGGENLHVLTTNEIPNHGHPAQGNPSTTGGSNIVAGDYFGASTVNIYAPATNTVTLVSQTISNAGLSQGHQNMMPSLLVNYCIALQGIYPSPP
jgi:microcystin-dependent protein